MSDLTRQEAIHEKGFSMGDLEFNNIKIGKKKLEDVVLDIGTLQKQRRTLVNKQAILKDLADKNLKNLRETSNYIYRTNNIYARICNYFAQMYRYDWLIVTENYEKQMNADKVLKDFKKTLTFFDNSYIKKACMDIALQVIINGCYYAIVVPNKSGVFLQELPIEYCRTRYSRGTMPIVELNMSFFDEKFADPVYRVKVLKLFPEDVQKGYILYKQGKLPSEGPGQAAGWYVLEPGSAVKFDFNNGDVPLFAAAIPALLDLDVAQEIDRRKQMQKLMKILVQKLPIDKNGDLIFDIDEAKDIHMNAVKMLADAIGVDVITTFAEMEAIDLAKNTATTTNDELEKVERSLYNAFGVSTNMFNADGNLALSNSILNDESYCRTLLLQFSAFYDQVAQLLSSNPKKYKFRFYMLETTQYNYKELSKLYKEQVQLGYPRELPQVALGHSQSFILNACEFETKVLNLNDIMIPPMSSNTMSNKMPVKGKDDKSSSGKKQEVIETKGDSGRPEKPDTEKSEKTIANKESMN